MKRKALFITALIITTITVNGQIIHVPSDQPTIQAGIDAANSGDTILVAEGTYYENIRFFGKAITVASKFLMDGDESHIENTVIDGSQAADPDSASCVMFIDGEDTTSIIKGFTIKGGGGNFYTNLNAMHGGGIVLQTAGGKIEDNIITENIVEHDHAAGGAGISALTVGGDKWLVVRNNTITFNTAITNGLSAFGGGLATTINSVIENNLIENNECNNSEGSVDGGGIEVEQLSGVPISVHIGNNEIRSNLLVSRFASGGGISLIQAEEVVVFGNQIDENLIEVDTSGYGGGIFAYHVTNLGIQNNSISQNVINGYRGYGAALEIRNTHGGLLVESNGMISNSINVTYGSAGSAMRITNPVASVKVTDNHMNNNIATGAEFSFACFFLWDALEQEVMVDRNRFIGNKAEYGAAFYARNSNCLKMSNNIMAHNEAGTNGGAIMLFEYLTKGDPDNPDHYNMNTPIQSAQVKSSGNHACFANNTFLANTAGVRGGAIYTEVDVNFPVFFNSIFSGNTATFGKDIFSYGTVPIVLDHSNFNPSNIGGSFTGDDNIFCDPSFEEDSLHLAPNSGCINSGTDTLLVDGSPYCCPVTDIDGEPRPYENTLPDMGADESPYMTVTGSSAIRLEAPESPAISCFPNPFTGFAEIVINVKHHGSTWVRVLDIDGRQVETLLKQSLPAGQHKLVWDASRLGPGAYFLELISGHISIMQKVILLNNP